MVNDKEPSRPTLIDYFAAEYSPLLFTSKISLSLFCLNSRSTYYIQEVGQYPASLNMPKARLYHYCYLFLLSDSQFIVTYVGLAPLIIAYVLEFSLIKVFQRGTSQRKLGMLQNLG